MELYFSPEQWDELRAHLFNGRPEWVAFLYARHEGEHLAIEAIDHIPSHRYAIQGPYHIELDEDVRPEVIKAAFDRNAVLIEVHSHRRQDVAAFSPTDLDGLADFVPHVLWRLPNRPYIALVLANESYDGLIWPKRGAEAAAITGIRIGELALEPTGASLAPIMKREPSA